MNRIIFLTAVVLFMCSCAGSRKEFKHNLQRTMAEKGHGKKYVPNALDSLEIVFKRIRYLDTSLPLEQYGFLIETKEKGISVGKIVNSKASSISKNNINNSLSDTIVISMLPPDIYSLENITYGNYYAEKIIGIFLEYGKYYTLENITIGKVLNSLAVKIIEETDPAVIEKAQEKLAEDFLILNQYTEWSKENPGIFEGIYRNKVGGKVSLEFSGNRFTLNTSALAGRFGDKLKGQFWYDEKTLIMKFDDNVEYWLLEYNLYDGILKYSGYMVDKLFNNMQHVLLPPNVAWIKDDAK